tara:strand:+ start:7583 stop:7693 length:111 start_codon:yes stop_codon:yes gene_type:complete
MESPIGRMFLQAARMVEAMEGRAQLCHAERGFAEIK